MSWQPGCNSSSVKYSYLTHQSQMFLQPPNLNSTLTPVSSWAFCSLRAISNGLRTGHLPGASTRYFRSNQLSFSTPFSPLNADRKRYNHSKNNATATMYNARAPPPKAYFREVIIQCAVQRLMLIGVQPTTIKPFWNSSQ